MADLKPDVSCQFTKVDVPLDIDQSAQFTQTALSDMTAVGHVQKETTQARGMIADHATLTHEDADEEDHCMKSCPPSKTTKRSGEEYIKPSSIFCSLSLDQSRSTE